MTLLTCALLQLQEEAGYPLTAFMTLLAGFAHLSNSSSTAQLSGPARSVKLQVSYKYCLRHCKLHGGSVRTLLLLHGEAVACSWADVRYTGYAAVPAERVILGMYGQHSALSA